MRERLVGYLMWMLSMVVCGDEWYSFDPPGSNGVGLWKNITKGWSLFCSHTKFIIGHGFKIRFWNWCGEMTLKETFLVLYDIARDKDALVAAHLVLENGSLQWDVGFIRAAHD
jgi:hypothetical protein